MENAIQIEDKEERDDHLLTGIGLIEKRNEILMSSNKHGWECTEAYSRSPLADNSDDKKKIKKALKEAKSVKEKKLSVVVGFQKRHFPTMQRCRFGCPVNPEYNVLLPTLRSAGAL